MSRRKPIDAKILEASKEFDARTFAETIKGTFSEEPYQLSVIHKQKKQTSLNG